MNSKKVKTKRFFTSAKIEFLIAFISVSLIATHGYAIHEDFINNEKLEVETSISNKITNVPKTGTTVIPILVYHKIATNNLSLSQYKKKKGGKYSVQEDIFESQMKFIINQGYTPLTMQKLIKAEQSNTLPLKPIAITFDDGWRSQYENALPILTKYKIPATFYIYTGVIGSPDYMTWDDLHALVNLDMEIGDHTKSHSRLTKIDPSKLSEELVESKNILEKNLHVQVSDFAYPYGDYNTSTIKALKSAGYISARTSNKGIYNDFKDLYQLNVLYAPTSLQTLQNMLTKSTL